MSCTEVMYQPYSPYFPYHQRAAAAASCPGGATASGIAAAQAACLDYKRFVSPKMHDLLAGSAAMAASPATPPSSLQSLGPTRSSSSSSSTSHHSRNHHSNHHNSSVVNSGSSGNSTGAHGGSGGGRSSSSSSSCAVASSPSTPLAARSPDHDEPGQAGKSSGGGSSTSAIGGGGHASVAVVTGGSSPSTTVAAGASSPGDAQYLSANCVVFTYYSGDISAVVDEHFSRALSETGAYDGSASCKSGVSQLKDAPPMSQRNFPASFWNCHQSPPGGSPSHGMGSGGGGVTSPVDLYTGSEPHAYHAHHAHHHASAANAAALHASLQSDPWHYALTAPQAGPYRSSAMHELAYSAAGSAHRFGAAAQQYGSLLLQPRSSRLGPVSATCTALDKGDAWASPAARYHHDQLAAAAGHHVVDASGYQAAHHHYGSMGAAAAAAAMTDPNSGGYMLELYKFQAMHAYR